MNKKQYKLNTFTGSAALADFLNPHNSPPAPLVELPPSCNPFSKDGIRIYAKLMNQLPLANVKAVSAHNMLADAQSKGGLAGVDTVVEYSSGNTIWSAAAVARAFGIKKAKTLISHEAFWSRIQMLRFLGIEVIVHKEPVFPKPFDSKSGIQKAIALGARSGNFCLRQYDNPANPDAHVKLTGPQIWKQMQGNVSIFCAGLGTTGTVLGTSKYLKSKNKNIFTIGVTRTVDSPVPGVRSKPRLNLVSFGWQKYVDVLEDVNLKDSYTHSLNLCRAGLLVGPSSGFALAGLSQFIKKAKKDKSLDRYRSKDGAVHAVFVCCDGPFQYLDEYFDYVDARQFPKVRNEQLLLNQTHKDYHRHTRLKQK